MNTYVTTRSVPVSGDTSVRVRPLKSCGINFTMEWNDVRAVGESKSVSRYSEFEPALCDPAVFSFRVVTDEPLGDLCLQ